MLSILLCIITIFFSKQFYVAALIYFTLPGPYYFANKKNTFGQCGQAINHGYPVKCLEDNINSSVLGEWSVPGSAWTERTSVIFFYIYTDPIKVIIREISYSESEKIYKIAVKLKSNRVSIGWESWNHWLFGIGIYDTNGIVKRFNVISIFDIIIRPRDNNTFEIDTEVKNLVVNMSCVVRASTTWYCDDKFKEFLQMGLRECLKGNPKCYKAFDFYADGKHISIPKYIETIARKSHQDLLDHLGA